MGLEALYPRPRTSRPGKGRAVYPYLLRNLTVKRPHQVWAADICSLPMARGFLFLVAVMDWSSRKVLSWRLSNTLDSDFCVEALEDALAHHERPEIFNPDQGAQFTSAALTAGLKGAAVAPGLLPAGAGSAWTARGDGWTTCSWTGCGGV